MRSRLGAITALTVGSLLATALPLGAHGVHHEIHRGEAAVLTLRFEDHSPLRQARCEVFAEGETEPCFTGTTDDQGRLAFLPPAEGRYTVRAATHDGHGARFEFETAELGRVASSAGGSRPGLLLGVAVILALFGGLAWWSRGVGRTGS